MGDITVRLHLNGFNYKVIRTTVCSMFMCSAFWEMHINFTLS